MLVALSVRFWWGHFSKGYTIPVTTVLNSTLISYSDMEKTLTYLGSLFMDIAPEKSLIFPEGGITFRLEVRIRSFEQLYSATLPPPDRVENRLTGSDFLTCMALIHPKLYRDYLDNWLQNLTPK